MNNVRLFSWVKTTCASSGFGRPHLLTIMLFSGDAMTFLVFHAGQVRALLLRHNTVSLGVRFRFCDTRFPGFQTLGFPWRQLA